jgi:hypothetical protein
VDAEKAILGGGGTFVSILSLYAMKKPHQIHDALYAMFEPPVRTLVHVRPRVSVYRLIVFVKWQGHIHTI